MNGINELCDAVRETAYAIHLYHGHGHLEKVYENALAHRLRKAGIEVQQQYPLTVFDEDGTTIGEYFADLFVDGRLVVELKACRALADEHTASSWLPEIRKDRGWTANQFWQLQVPDQEIRDERKPSRKNPRDPSEEQFADIVSSVLFAFSCGK